MFNQNNGLRIIHRARRKQTKKPEVLKKNDFKEKKKSKLKRTKFWNKIVNKDSGDQAESRLSEYEVLRLSAAAVLLVGTVRRRPGGDYDRTAISHTTAAAPGGRE